MSKIKKILLVTFISILVLFIGLFAFFKLSIEPSLTISPAINRLKPTNEVNQQMIDTIYSKVATKMRNHSKIAFGIVDNGTIFYYGIEQKQDTLYTIELKDSLFCIGSISKVFTSCILANMVVNKKVKLDETVDKLLGFPLNNNLKINLVSLSNHTSGLDRVHDEFIVVRLKNIDNPYQSCSMNWMNDYLQNKISINKDSLGKVNYSNLGVAILGQGLSKSQDLSYSDLVENIIFSRFKMNHSFVLNQSLKSKVVKAYNSENEISKIWDMQSYIPAGGIVSNASDMTKFILAHIDTANRDLMLTHLLTTKVDATKGVGMGWFLIDKPFSSNILFHNGAIGSDGGYTSSIAIDQNNKKGIVILSSISFLDIDSILDKLNFSILSMLSKN